MGPQRLLKTRNRKRDLDQISTDILNPHRLKQHLSSLPLDELPALGQLYCTPCARFLESQHALAHHLRSKTHKKRVKVLKEPAYSHEEANAAVGRGIDNGLVRVQAEDVINRVGRARVLAKSNVTAGSGSVGGEMEVEDDVDNNDAPSLQLVNEAFNVEEDL
ncbi:hypothetical protein ABW20_dc0100994 [Dactylellina cionopaga]|nr:hypothetical protein ABW20_dc0100994 [Dactylellina cionopaga]